MTTLKVDSKASPHAAEAMAPHAAGLFTRLSSTRMVVAELRSVERTEPEDKEQSVKVRLHEAEVATPEQEDLLRRLLKAMHTVRTAYGTLTEEEDVELAQSTMEQVEGNLLATRAAELSVGIDRHVDRLRNALSNNKVSNAQLRREVEKAVDGLSALSRGTYAL